MDLSKLSNFTDAEQKQLHEYHKIMQFYLKNHEEQVANNTLSEKDKECLFQAFYRAEEMCILKVHSDPTIIKKELDKRMEVRDTGFAIMKIRLRETNILHVIDQKIKDESKI